MILLKLISWPYFRKHALRTVLTSAGIVLGVATLVGMRTANQSVLDAFSKTVDRIAGKTELQVSAGENGFGEDILDVVQSASSVGVAVPVIEAVVDSRLKGQGSLLVLGIDMTGDRSLREYDLDGGDESAVEDPLIFLAQPDSLILSKEFAGRNSIAVGSRLTLGTAAGDKTFTVRGIVRSSGLASAYGGNIAVMDIYAAQKMFGRGRRFDRIDLATKPGTGLADCERELRSRLGPGFDVQPPSARGQQFEAMLSSYSMMVGISSLFALFIGMFIIYNSFAIAVTQRRSEIGILRALGATQSQIRALFLGESAVLGVIGSVGGLLIGVLAARMIASTVGSLIADVYGVAQRVTELSTSVSMLGTSLLIGVATSVVAAVIPASRAAAVDPVKALQKGRYQVLSSGEHRLRFILAGGFAALSVLCLVFARWRMVFYGGYLAAIVASLLLAPMMCLFLARLLRSPLKRLRPVEGALAADSLIQAPRRTSASVAALMLSLALIVAFAGMARASYNSIVSWMQMTLNPDLFVLPSQNLVSQTMRFPATMAPEIENLGGVDHVQMVRNGRVTYRGTPIMVVAIEVGKIAQTVELRPVAGQVADMCRRSAAGEGLMVSENFAELQHLTLGETVEIQAPYGTIRLPIVGVVVDLSDQQGAIVMDRNVFIKYWHDDSVNIFRVYVKRDAPATTVRQQILDRFAGERQVFVLTNADLRSHILKIADQWFGLTTVQVAIAVVVAILGIINTLTVSIIDRRRELGVLQALGGVRGQIRRTVWLEAIAIGTIGIILGCALGGINLYYILQIVHHDITGIRLDYEFPAAMTIGLAPIILAAAFVAGIWPAEMAVRGSLVSALEYE